MVVTALDIVATYAAVPIRIERLIDILFTVAFALQGAVWARELVFGVISRKAGEEPTRDRGRQRHGGHPRARQRRRVRAGDRRHSRQSGRERHRAGRRARRRRHCHRPRRARHLLGPVRRPFDPVRQALPARRHIQYDQTTGTVERIGLKTTRLRSVNGEQVVIANTKLLEREIHNFNAGRSRRSSLPFGVVYQTAPDELEKVPSLVKGGGRSAQRLYASFAAPFSASAPRASTSSCL